MIYLYFFTSKKSGSQHCSKSLFEAFPEPQKLSIKFFFSLRKKNYKKLMLFRIFYLQRRKNEGNLSDAKYEEKNIPFKRNRKNMFLNIYFKFKIFRCSKICSCQVKSMCSLKRKNWGSFVTLKNSINLIKSHKIFILKQIFKRTRVI